MRYPDSQVSLGRKYKSRKERPCDACRKRKICCTRDAYEKDCSLCRTRGESCQYVLPPNVRRSRQVSTAPPRTSTSSPGESGSVLSRLVETTPRRPSTSSDGDGNGNGSGNGSGSLSGNGNGIGNGIGIGNGLGIGNGNGNGNGSGSGSGNGNGHGNGNGNGNGIENGNGIGNGNGNGEWICQFAGLSGDQDPYVLRHCSFNQQNCYRGAEWAVVKIKGDPNANGDVPLHFIVVPDTQLNARPVYYPTTDTEAVVLPHANDLLHTYFEVVHQSYPLLEPSRFNRPPETGDPLLAAVYNLAAPFCSSSPPHFPALSSFVQQALPIEHHHPRLETLEASLLHLQLVAPSSPSPTLPGLSSSIGALVGIAHDLGLNHDPSSWSLSPQDTNRRIRIWWALYIQDKWSALGLGRPSHLNDEQNTVPLPTISNFSHLGLASAPLTLTPALQFIAMAHLSTILSDILNAFYTLKAMERVRLLPVEMLFSILDGFQERLRIFRDEHLCPLCSGDDHGGPDSTGSVVLAFYTMEIVLLRAVLRCLPMSHLGYAGLRAQAKTTLLNVVEFIEKMNVSRLKAFWWSPMTRLNFSLAGSFMFFQFLTSHTRQDVELWSATIAHYRSLLRLHTASFEMTRLASMRMDLLAQGMGVDSPLPLNLEREDRMRQGGGVGGGVGFSGVRMAVGVGECAGFGDVMGRDAPKGEVMDPGSADEWIMRHGDGELLLC